MTAHETTRMRWHPHLTVTKLLVATWVAMTWASAGAADGVSTPAGPEGPAQIAYAPAKGPGPAVILLSGQSGPALYQEYAAEVASLGYYAVLLDGKDILTRTQDGAANLKNAIERAQRSQYVVPGKSAVIGFSQGGGGALAYATNMTESSNFTSTTWNPCARRWQVPDGKARNARRAATRA